ncbi:MAG: type II and III secretion system protein [Fretibacterium sp.]|nr:type II and III secretion system protein [Fretibacterium sp.]
MGWTLRRMALAFAVLVMLCVSSHGAESRRESGDGAVLSGCELYQLGASEVFLELSGRGLPEPEMSLEGEAVRFVLRNCRAELREGADYAAAAPLIFEMGVRQDEGDVVVGLVPAAPLRLRFSHGTAPANRYTFRLVTQEEAERLRRGAGSTKGQGLPAVTPPPGAVTDEGVTLDLRDVELRDVFRMLGTFLKKNIIIDPSCPSARVTLMLKDLSAGEALNYLMKAYGVRQHTMGEDTIVLGTRDGLARLSGEEETRAFRIAYADPAAVQGILAGMTGLPVRCFAVDPRLKVLYVTSNPQKLEETAALLQSLDRPGRQVMIQAKIFELTDGSEREVETALNAVYDHWWFSYSPQGGGRGGYIRDNGRGRSFSVPSNGYPLPGMTGLETPLEGVWREFDAAFSALETKGKGRTLASPSVIALDGQGAKISLTEDYPYISGRDEAGNPTWSSETVGPQLTLTPRVGRQGVITLQIEITTGEVLEMITGSTGEQMPRTSTRSVTTHVRVRDGEPFVMGGLFRDNQTHRRVRMPIVGEIPLLGSLFTYRYDERNRTQAVIVVIPHILDMPDTPVERTSPGRR